MAEVSQFQFDLKEIAEALVKRQGLHEGHWHVAIEFGFMATNIKAPNREAQLSLIPAAINTILGVVLQRVDESNELCVDAATVNPKPRKKAVAGRKPR